MNNLELQKCILGPVYTNCYFLKNKVTGEMIIIDPADCPEKIEQKVMQMDGKPVAILLTHGHFDHIMGIDSILENWNIPVYVEEEDLPIMTDPELNLSSSYTNGYSFDGLAERHRKTIHREAILREVSTPLERYCLLNDCEPWECLAAVLNRMKRPRIALL